MASSSSLSTALPRSAGATRVATELAEGLMDGTGIEPWMLHLLQADIPLEMLRTGYSPGTTDLVTEQYSRATAVPTAPSFNPAALGDTTLWNEVDPDKDANILI